MQSMEEMMKAAQEAAQKIQQQMSDAQVKLDNIEVEGSSGGGLVKVRASARGRHAGVIALQMQTNPGLGAHALDLGADDLMPDGFNAAELALRIKAVMRRKRMGDQLRATVRTGLQAAVFDPLLSSTKQGHHTFFIFMCDRGKCEKLVGCLELTT